MAISYFFWYKSEQHKGKKTKPDFHYFQSIVQTDLDKYSYISIAYIKSVCKEMRTGVDFIIRYLSCMPVL